MYFPSPAMADQYTLEPWIEISKASRINETNKKQMESM